MSERRKKEIIKLVKFFRDRFRIHGYRMLDLGCGDGELTVEVSRILNIKEVYGVDIKDDSLLIASKRGIKPFKIDLSNEKLPFKNDMFEFVSSFDTIQYLVNTDNLISEAYRVLKPGGYFMITTVNLASWVNRLLMLLGFLPVFYEPSLFVDIEKRPFQESRRVGGVIRLYTFKTLENHLTYYGFRIIYSTTFSTLYTSKNLPMKIIDKIASKRKTLGGNIALLAKK